MLSSIAFFLYVVLPLLAWLLRKRSETRRSAFFCLFFLTIVTGSFLYISGVWLIGWELERIWDPDENGQLDDPTPEMTKAMDDWASDTGRSFAPIIALPATFIWVLLNFAIFSAVGAILKLLNEKKTERDRTKCHNLKS